MNRFTRIVPLYWVMIFVTAAALLVFAGRASSPGQIAASLLFLPYLDTATGLVQPVLGVGWTLNLEILFYVLFAATMGFGTLRQIAAIGALFAIAVAARVVFKPAPDTVPFFYSTPLQFEFLAGMALGHVAGRLARLPVPLAVSAVMFAVVSALVLILGFDLPRTLSHGGPALFLVIGCIALESHFRRLAPRILTGLGDASYSLYLTHTIVLLAAVPLVAAADVSSWIAGPVLVAVCVAVSFASYGFIEKPLLALSRMNLPARRVRHG